MHTNTTHQQTKFFCDICDDEHDLVCPLELESRVEEILEGALEYEATHQDAGNDYAHLPREGGWFYHNCGQRLADFLDQHGIDASHLDWDQLADLVLNNFEMVSRHMFSRVPEDVFEIDSYMVGEIEVHIELSMFDVPGLTLDHLLSACSDLRANGDSALGYTYSDMRWSAEIDVATLAELIENEK